MNQRKKILRCDLWIMNYIPYYIDRTDYTSGFSQKNCLRRNFFIKKSCLRRIFFHEKSLLYAQFLWNQMLLWFLSQWGKQKYSGPLRESLFFFRASRPQKQKLFLGLRFSKTRNPICGKIEWCILQAHRADKFLFDSTF